MRYQILVLVHLVFGDTSTVITVTSENFSVNDCIQRIIHDSFRNQDVLVIKGDNALDVVPNGNPRVIAGLKQVNFHTNILLKSNDFDRELLRQFGRNKKIVIIAKTTTDANMSVLFSMAYGEYKTKLGFVTVEGNSVNFSTTLDFNTKQFCPHFYFKKYFGYCSEERKMVTASLDINAYCQMKVSWVERHPFVNDVYKRKNPGIMVSWIETYAAFRNVKIIYKNSEAYRLEFLNNGSYWKLIQNLLHEKLDVAIGYLFMNNTLQYPVDYGPVIYNDNIGIATRRLRKIPNYRKMVIVFDKNVWISFLCTSFLTVLLYFFMSFAADSRSSELMTVFIDVFRLSLSASLPMLPTRPPVRVLLVFFAIFGMIIDVAYLSKLSSIFCNPPKDLHEDYWANGLRGKLSWIMERLVLATWVGSRNTTRKEKKAEAGNYKINMTDQDLLTEIALNQVNGTGTFFSTLWSCPTMAALVDFERFYDTYLTMSVTFYIAKHVPLTDSLQYWTLKLVEAGLVNKWASEVIPPMNYTILRKYETPDVVALRLGHFDVVFYLLAIGYLSGGFVLVLEIIYKRLKSIYHN